MPALIAALIGALGRLLMTVIPIIMGWAVTFFSKKAAVYIAIILSAIALFVTLWAGIAALVSTVQHVLPSWIATAIYMFWPANGSAIVSAIVSFNVGLSIYKTKFYALLAMAR